MKLLAAAVVLSIAPATVWAQAYPNKPIRIVLGLPAGSGSDTVVRLLIEPLGAAMGQRFLVDNKPGSNGVIAAEDVKRAAPDGYTLFHTTSTTNSAAPALMKSLPYDPLKDFTPIASTGSPPFFLAVNPAVQANTVPELIDLAKKNPGKLNYASGTAGAQVWMEALKRVGQVDIVRVPYNGTPPALLDVVKNEAQMLIVDYTTGAPQLKENKIRALAVASDKRSELLPGLPSMQESGIGGIRIAQWSGLVGPAGMPNDIVQRLNVEWNKVLNNPEIAAKLKGNFGLEPSPMSQPQFQAFLADQLEQWVSLIRSAGIQPE